MQTNPVTPPPSSVPSRGFGADLDKSAFLKLLVTQMKMQDPTRSGDPNQMIQQITSFASLEQMTNTNRLLETIQVQNQGLFQAQAASLVGKQIRVSSNGFELKNGQAAVKVTLAADADVTLKIKDAQGQVVATVPKGSFRAGSHDLTWDGRNEQGVRLPDGQYTLEVVARGADGRSVEAQTSFSIRVASVLFQNGAVIFTTAGGQRYALRDVLEISA